MSVRGTAEDVPEARKRQAARLLLARPLLVAGQTADDEFRLVRAYAAELREWFDRERCPEPEPHRSAAISAAGRKEPTPGANHRG